MRKLVSILLTVAVILAMSVPMFAFAEGTTTSITTPNVSGHTYDIYQIFTGDVASDGNKLSNVEAGDNLKLESGKKVSDALDAINGAISATDDRAKLDVIEKYVDFDSTPIKSGVTANTKVEVDAGYYLVKDHSAASGDNSVNTAYLVRVAGTVTLEAKSSVPSVDKKVQDINDTTGDDSKAWGKTADYDIGDDIAFEITGSLPDTYADYKEYYYQFTDTATNMTINADSVDVKIGTKSIKDQCTIDTTTAGKLIVKIADVKKLTDVTVDKDTKIVVTYTAKLTEDAVVGATGNPNTVKVTYSNDPNYESSGTPGSDNPPTGDTPESKNVVFTYETVVKKLDDSNKSLAGAGFTLNKEVNGKWTKIKEFTAGTETTFTFTGLDDGKYQLVESTTPDGYNTIKPVEFTISATHNDETLKLDTLTVDNADFTVADDLSKISTDIVNTPGKALPTTGGIGTTIFYLIGAILVLGAAIVLIARRRAGAR